MNEKRKILASGKVYTGSLPLALRHICPADALEDAKALTSFLCYTVDASSAFQGVLGAEDCRGLSLVLDLLMDKINIGSGDYKFPTLGWGDDVPALAERRGGEWPTE